MGRYDTGWGGPRRRHPFLSHLTSLRAKVIARLWRRGLRNRYSHVSLRFGRSPL